MDNSASFSQAFDFSRAREAAFRNNAGQLVTAEYDEPRLDHDPYGQVLGLLVEGNPDTIVIDNCRCVSNRIGAGQQGTVLHELINHRGLHRRVALYTLDGRATVNARLSIRGHHRQIIFFPTFRQNLGGYVRFDHQVWELPGGLDAGGGAVLGSDGNILGGAV